MANGVIRMFNGMVQGGQFAVHVLETILDLHVLITLTSQQHKDLLDVRGASGRTWSEVNFMYWHVATLLVVIVSQLWAYSYRLILQIRGVFKSGHSRGIVVPLGVARQQQQVRQQQQQQEQPSHHPGRSIPFIHDDNDAEVLIVMHMTLSQWIKVPMFYKLLRRLLTISAFCAPLPVSSSNLGHSFFRGIFDSDSRGRISTHLTRWTADTYFMYTDSLVAGTGRNDIGDARIVATPCDKLSLYSCLQWSLLLTVIACILHTYRWLSCSSDNRSLCAYCATWLVSVLGCALLLGRPLAASIGYGQVVVSTHPDASKYLRLSEASLVFAFLMTIFMFMLNSGMQLHHQVIQAITNLLCATTQQAGSGNTTTTSQGSDNNKNRLEHADAWHRQALADELGELRAKIKLERLRMASAVTPPHDSHHYDDDHEDRSTLSHDHLTTRGTLRDLDGGRSAIGPIAESHTSQGEQVLGMRCTYEGPVGPMSASHSQSCQSGHTSSSGHESLRLLRQVLSMHMYEPCQDATATVPSKSCSQLGVTVNEAGRARSAAVTTCDMDGVDVMDFHFQGGSHVHHPLSPPHAPAPPAPSPLPAVLASDHEHQYNHDVQYQHHNHEQPVVEDSSANTIGHEQRSSESASHGKSESADSYSMVANTGIAVHDDTCASHNGCATAGQHDDGNAGGRWEIKASSSNGRKRLQPLIRTPSQAERSSKPHQAHDHDNASAAATQSQTALDSSHAAESVDAAGHHTSPLISTTDHDHHGINKQPVPVALAAAASFLLTSTYSPHDNDDDTQRGISNILAGGTASSLHTTPNTTKFKKAARVTINAPKSGPSSHDPGAGPDAKSGPSWMMRSQLVRRSMSNALEKTMSSVASYSRRFMSFIGHKDHIHAHLDDQEVRGQMGPPGPGDDGSILYGQAPGVDGDDDVGYDNTAAKTLRKLARKVSLPLLLILAVISLGLSSAVAAVLPTQLNMSNGWAPFDAALAFIQLSLLFTLTAVEFAWFSRSESQTENESR